MTLANPQYARLYVLVPALLLFLWWSARTRKRLLEVFARPHLIGRITPSVSPAARRWKTALVGGAALTLITSAVGPQWGFRWVEAKRKGVDIIIALDTSRSMLAEDVKPNRLERAKLAVQELVTRLEGDRVGLMAFSGASFLQCPLTHDHGAFLLVLERLTTDVLPRGGTAIREAILEATKAFEPAREAGHNALVLITDGEDHEGDTISAAKEAAGKGITVYAIGVGSPEGELIPVTGPDGTRTFVKDAEGEVVKSRLNEELLQRIALETGGAYQRATAMQFGLVEIYEKRISRGEKKEQEARLEKRFQNRYQFVLALGFLAIFLEAMLGERKRGA